MKRLKYQLLLIAALLPLAMQAQTPQKFSALHNTFAQFTPDGKAVVMQGATGIYTQPVPKMEDFMTAQVVYLSAYKKIDLATGTVSNLSGNTVFAHEDMAKDNNDRSTFFFRYCMAQKAPVINRDSVLNQLTELNQEREQLRKKSLGNGCGYHPT